MSGRLWDPKAKDRNSSHADFMGRATVRTYYNTSKVERSETATELRSLFIAKFSPDLRFLDGFGTGSPGATQKSCLKLNRKCRTRDIPQWHFSPVVLLASKTTQVPKQGQKQGK